MQLNEFPYLEPNLINLEANESIDGLQESLPVHLHTYDDEWLLHQGELRVPVSCYVKSKALLNGLTLRDQTRWLLAQVEPDKKRLQLQYLAPVEVQQLDLQLGVDGLIADDLFTKNEIGENSIKSACEWLQQNFVVINSNPQDSTQKQETWLTISRFSNEATNNGFQLLGKGWRADIEEQKDGTYLIKRITRHHRQDSPYSLLVGEFSFVDSSIATALNSASYKAQLQAALRDNGSYLELWNLYNDKEWDNALKQAEHLKALRFTHAEPFEDGRTNRYRIWPKSSKAFKDFRERWRSLELMREQQVDLSQQPPDWGEELSTSDNDTTTRRQVEQNSRGQISFEEDHVVFTPASSSRKATPNFPAPEPDQVRTGAKQGSKGGWLFLSLAGQRTVARRRRNARLSIESGRRMPQLKALLEGVAVPSERHHPIKALTPYVKESFKGGIPTSKQKLALETALNTPDVAIIIGPPGTGKTQVIAALQRRMAELFDNQAIAGQVLVSSFQHDAVDNALDRSQVFNLPGVRVGGKTAKKEQEGSFNRWIEAQTRYLNEQISKQYEQAPSLKILDDITRTIMLLRISQYSSDHYMRELKALLKQVKALSARTNGHRPISLPERLLYELDEYIKQQQTDKPISNASTNTKTLIRKIRGLRTTAASFADDGKQRAADLLREFKQQLNTVDTEVETLLSQAASSDNAMDQLLQQLGKTKNRLLDQYLPDYRPPELKHKLDAKGTELLNQLESALQEHVQRQQQGIAWALQELASSIETDHQSAINTVEEYAMVVGATCQQAAGNQMANLKKITGLEDKGVNFDTVIVDEAARANPLDLFIPMSMANRRIVLVGDDRQLPHMLEPDIENQLQEEHQLTAQQLEAFKSSLFERLRVKLQTLQKQDDITRVVMLDTQFRMHPILGDFVSQQFYESEGLEKVKSGRAAEDFSFNSRFIDKLREQNLDQYYEGKVCQWLGVAGHEGKAEKRGTSRVRRAEAERIATEIKQLFVAELAANPAGPNSLSIGVITFYAAQRDLIMQVLSNTKVNGIPLMIKTPEGYQPHENFKNAFKPSKDGTSRSEEGLRVGSVDAFQGKEFDVVFLSCVRTWNHANTHKSHQHENSKGSDTSPQEIMLNRQFGFLRLPNRMNVATSRQRQMLICVGDTALVNNKLAEEGIPALNAFYQLCGGQHGSIR